MVEKFVYFGNLFPDEPQYKSDKFIGLALDVRFDKDVLHDARSPMKFEDDSVPGFQSQDVFEHIEFSKIPSILDDIYRCLKPGGLFRLSLPDYRSPVLSRRSAYNFRGEVILDVAMGGSLAASHNGEIVAKLPSDGSAHLWHPKIEDIYNVIVKSNIRKCSKILFHHYWKSSFDYVADEFDQTQMPVSRTPPKDMRAGGGPISIVVDFIK